jgi:transglutaminase-like putative cysteine protease
MYGVPARDDIALARLAQQYTQTRIKYFKEAPERWQSPLRTLVWGIGDCDDMAILIASWLRSFRIPVRLKFLRMTIPAGSVVREPGASMRKLDAPRKVSHVYAQALLGGKWTTLEAVKAYPLGFDPEVLAQQKGIAYTTETIGDGG